MATGQEFTSTKDFSVGDLFLNREGKVCCYIVKIVQYKKGSQYEYEVSYFNKDRDRMYYPKFMNTLRLKDSIRFGGWKHVPMVK
jgi:hypothetical protein